MFDDSKFEGTLGCHTSTRVPDGLYSQTGPSRGVWDVINDAEIISGYNGDLRSIDFKELQSE